MPPIEDRDIELPDDAKWRNYAPAEPNRFEDWKSQAIVYGLLAFFAVGGAVSLWLFLTGRVR